MIKRLSSCSQRTYVKGQKISGHGYPTSAWGHYLPGDEPHYECSVSGAYCPSDDPVHFDECPRIERISETEDFVTYKDKELNEIFEEDK